MNKENEKRQISRKEFLLIPLAVTMGKFLGSCGSAQEAGPMPTRRPLKPTFTPTLPETKAIFPTRTLSPMPTPSPTATETPTQTPTSTLPPPATETPTQTPTSTLPPTRTLKPTRARPQPTETLVFTETVPATLIKVASVEWSINCGYTGVEGDIFDINGEPVNNMIFLLENEWGFRVVSIESGAGALKPGHFNITLASGQEAKFNLRPLAHRLRGEASSSHTSDQLLAEIESHPERFRIFSQDQVERVLLDFSHCSKNDHQVAMPDFKFTQ